jgi:TatA/E family protein of Tat protein translocase
VFNMGVGEMILVLLVALVVFGPNKLPEVARSMGKFLRNFQLETNRALNDLKQGIEPVTKGIFDEPDAGTPVGEIPTVSAAPAAAFRTTPGTKRKTSARAATTRSKPVTAKKKTATAPAKKKPVAKKPVAKKTAKR